VNNSGGSFRFWSGRASAPSHGLWLAEKLIGDGFADFIGFGRAIVADHQFANKELANRLEAVNRCRWDSFCLRDKKEPLASRVYCCVNDAYLRPQHIQVMYQEK